MYRHLRPGEARQLPMRMLFQPAAGGLFLKACEADSWRGLVAALVDDPAYESADAETRLVQRLRLADDAALLAELQGQPGVRLSDHDADATLNVSSDSRLILSLHRLGFVSLEPALAASAPDLAGGVSPDVDYSQ
jgi:hypothetical protein